MLNLLDVTLFTLYVPWNPNREMTQEGEHEKKIFDGVEKTIKALYTSMNGIKYGAVKFVTSKEVITQYGAELLADGIVCEEVKVPMNNMKDYAEYYIYHITHHIDTKFCLNIQYDGFVINRSAWKDEFLDYDYVGAPWPWRENAFVTPYGEHIDVGNGGFGLLSKKLLDVPKYTEIIFDVNQHTDFYKMFGSYNFNADGNICVHNRHKYIEMGCKFAPIEVAKYFSHETTMEVNRGIIPFGFHQNLPDGIILE